MRTPLRLLLAALVTLAVLGVAPAGAGAAPLSGAKNVASRSALNCAALTNGQIRCWGEGDSGQLGTGALVPDATTGVTVLNDGNGAALTGVAHVSVGRDHACARLNNGRARCWGRNTHGQLGDGTTEQRTRAVLVRNGNDTAPLEGIAQISVGAHHTCARLANGQARCWGMNSWGQLGTGNTTHSPLPKIVRSVSGNGALTSVGQIVTGERHSCARRTNGQARCWGENEEGQLGDGTTTDRTLPRTVVAVSGPGALTGVTQIATTAEHTCARLSNGQARCWGDDSHGELADGYGFDPETVNRPEVVDAGPPVDGIAPALTGVVQVTAGGSHSCFRLNNGRVRCAGLDSSGQLANPDTADDAHTAKVVRDGDGVGPLAGVAQITAGGSHTCARLTGKQVRCWGADLHGQLGNGAGPASELPVVVEVA